MPTTQSPLIALAAALPILGVAPELASADDNCTASRMLLMLDKSSSMLGEIEAQTKWDVAVDALGQVTSSYDQSMEIGLSVFPAEGECSVGALAVQPDFGTSAAIAAALAQPPPEGGNWTPMAQSLDAAVSETSLNQDNPSYVVLITDGWQYCIPYDESTRFAPVDSVQRLSDAGITTFVVGFGDGVDAATLNQMAVMAGTDRPDCDPTGDTPTAEDPCYYQADSPSDLVNALMGIAQQIPNDEVCDGLDNDCDGEVDEALVQDCSSACGSGSSVCTNGAWGECDAPVAEVEICDGVDNDCDGMADEVDDEPLCGPDDVCDAGECVPVGGAHAGCGCELGRDADARSILGGVMPMMLAFLVLVARRRRDD